jgi:hypothetical protein
MSTALSSGNADITNHASYPSSRHQDSEALPPYVIKLVQEVFVHRNIAELALVVRVLL